MKTITVECVILGKPETYTLKAMEGLRKRDLVLLLHEHDWLGHYMSPDPKKYQLDREAQRWTKKALIQRIMWAKEQPVYVKCEHCNGRGRVVKGP